MTAHYPEWPHACARGRDIPETGREQPRDDQQSDPLRTYGEMPQGCLPAVTDGLEQAPRAHRSRGVVCIALRYPSSIRARFDALPGMVERRCAIDGGHHQVGQNHGIVLVEAAILLLVSTQGVDDDVW